MSQRVTESMSLEVLFNRDDVDTPMVAINGVEYIVDGLTHGYTNQIVNEPTAPVVLVPEHISMGGVLTLFFRPEREEGFEFNAALLYLDRPNRTGRRFAIVNPTALLAVSHIVD